MVEVTIKKANKKQKDLVIDFLFERADSICLNAYHIYKIDEDSIDILIDEYKERCKEKLHAVRETYRKNPSMFENELKKIDIETEEQFEEHTLEIYQEEIANVELMRNGLKNLSNLEDDVSYLDLFPSIANSFLEKETHLYSPLSEDVVPFDYLIYKADEPVREFLKEGKTISFLSISEIDDKYALFDPMFCKNEEGFAIISSEMSLISMHLNEKDYDEFCKLKIRHEAEFQVNE